MSFSLLLSLVGVLLLLVVVSLPCFLATLLVALLLLVVVLLLVAALSFGQLLVLPLLLSFRPLQHPLFLLVFLARGLVCSVLVLVVVVLSLVVVLRLMVSKPSATAVLHFVALLLVLASVVHVLWALL